MSKIIINEIKFSHYEGTVWVCDQDSRITLEVKHIPKAYDSSSGIEWVIKVIDNKLNLLKRNCGDTPQQAWEVFQRTLESELEQIISLKSENLLYAQG